MKREQIISNLKEKGYRITKQRLYILDAILEERCFSCKEIYYKVLKRDHKIGAATVYRMLNTLEEIEAVTRGNVYNVVQDEELEQGQKVDQTGRQINTQVQSKEQKLLDQLEIDYHEIIECITCALDAKDAYTAGHSQRVSDMAMKVCELMGLKGRDIEKIHIAAHLHDIGKIGVSDAVLNKTEKLNDEEWQIIKKHPSIGAQILSKSHHLKELKDIVLCHHERYDGKGYPLGLKGEQIPVGSRIIAICDSIDAMTSNRSYRRSHDFQYCYTEIEKNLGTMYDPMIGKFVLKHWDEVIGVIKKDNEAF